MTTRTVIKHLRTSLNQLITQRDLVSPSGEVTEREVILQTPDDPDQLFELAEQVRRELTCES
jgi:hypothetical protein